MTAAIAQAKQGLQEGGIPIGSVLVKGGQIIGQGYNKRVQDNDPVTHAEIDCLRHAGRIGNYNDTILYSTLMPCYLFPVPCYLFPVPCSLTNDKLIKVHQNFTGFF